ncbi:MAG: histidine phosphatase family protein [Flavitalea sp.]
MLTIYLLRHGQTFWNAENNRYCGRSDIGLTELGYLQAEEARKQLEGLKFEAIYCSPLQRAFITATIASGASKDDTITIIKDERLIESDFGSWEGKTKDEFVAENEQLWINWMADPAVAPAGGTGETATDVLLRVNDFYKSLQSKHMDGNILIVAHNNVNRFFMAQKLGMPLRNYRQLIQHNSAVTCFTLDIDGLLTLEYLNSRLK